MRCERRNTKCRRQMEWVCHQYRPNSFYSINQSSESWTEFNQLSGVPVHRFCCSNDVFDGYETSCEGNAGRGDCIQSRSKFSSPTKTCAISSLRWQPSTIGKYPEGAETFSLWVRFPVSNRAGGEGRRFIWRKRFWGGWIVNVWWRGTHRDCEGMPNPHQAMLVVLSV